ncbi:MAG: hypothetical protein PVH21_04445 [Myxococcales bacterium]|jgi:hypothetical protein
MKIRFAFLLVMVGLIATVSSCNNRSLNALNPCTINGVVQNVPVNPQRALDLLILIDDSPSMEQEQAKLAEQVPRLVNLLLTGGVDTDGSTPVGDFPAVESLHVGIITPDLGWSTEPQTSYSPPDDFNPTPACETNNGLGKAGFMQTTGLIDDDNNPSTERVACEAQTPPQGTLYLNYPEPPYTANDLIDDVECVTGQTAGCGFEQQLEAILASNRNTANGGFNREDALLAVIVITDEDDCSTTDPRVFDVQARESNPYQGPFADPPTNDLVQFNLRCWAHSEALQQIERYVSGIASLKADPSQVVFAAITGIPEDRALDRVNFNSDEDRYQAILESADMVEEPGPLPANPTIDDLQRQQLRPACTATDGSGTAAPARRIVEVAEGLATSTGVGTVVESICASDYAPALNAIVDRIAAALRQLCLPRPLNRNANGLVGCEVREVQPEGQTCATAGRGREPEPVGNEDGREVCRVTQLSSATGVPDGLGWYYDDLEETGVQEACSFNPTQQRVSFTEGASPVSGARIRFECLQAAPPQDVDIGWPCSAETDCNPTDCLDGETPEQCETRVLQERYDRDNLQLSCDPASNTCQLTCESNVQCPGGFACYDENDDGTSYCVNPTCSLN